MQPLRYQEPLAYGPPFLLRPLQPRTSDGRHEKTEGRRRHQIARASSNGALTNEDEHAARHGVKTLPAPHAARTGNRGFSVARSCETNLKMDHERLSLAAPIRFCCFSLSMSLFACAFAFRTAIRLPFRLQRPISLAFSLVFTRSL